jgi:hypothetical protein
MTHPIVDLLAIGRSDRDFCDRIENRRPADRRDAVPGNSGGFQSGIERARQLSKP